MKILTAVAIAQLFLLAFGLVKFNAFEQSLAQLEQRPPANNEVMNVPASSDQLSQGTQTFELDTELVRTIIREELQHALLAIESATTVTQEVSEPGLDPVEMAYRAERVLLQLDQLKASTEVSSAELDDLIAEMATLDPASRTELLKDLNRALNSGEIKGRL